MAKSRRECGAFRELVRKGVDEYLTAVFFGFFMQKEEKETKNNDNKKQQHQKKKSKKKKQTDKKYLSLRIIFVYTHISKDVRVEKILPREERRAGSRARAVTRLSPGEQEAGTTDSRLGKMRL